MNFKFKLCWRATSLILNVEAKDYDQALKRIKRQVSKMDGGEHVIDIIWLG